MAPQLRTSARFPDVALRRGHYESFYLKACRPDGGAALWIRYTVHKRPDAPARGSLWFTLFGADRAPHAVKQTFDAVSAPAGEHIRIGPAWLAPGRAEGRAEGEGRSASWELSFDGAAEPFHHLPRPFLYRAPLPRTKLLSPYPDIRLTGSLRFGEDAVEVGGWPGMVGHNWGAEHAERWIWMHGACFEDQAGAWLDVALGRIRIGRFVTPWVANGVLSLDGRRHRLGGPGRTRSTQVAETPVGADVGLSGSAIEVEGFVGAPRERFVGWVYADPDGSEHHTVNCSAADMTLTVRRPGTRQMVLTARGCAAYELGMREHDHGMAIEPFGDG